jgi:hypothetical protein
MQIIDALLGRPSAPKPQFSTKATVGQPVPVADIRTPPSQLTSGSSLNRASDDSWPEILNANFKIVTAFRKSVLVNPRKAILSGNYGSLSSRANYGFRYREFAGIGGLPNSNVRGHRSEYNELTPIVWGQRVPNPNGPNVNVLPQGNKNITSVPSVMTKAGVASIASRSVRLV